MVEISTALAEQFFATRGIKCKVIGGPQVATSRLPAEAVRKLLDVVKVMGIGADLFEEMVQVSLVWTSGEAIYIHERSIGLTNSDDVWKRVRLPGNVASIPNTCYFIPPEEASILRTKRGYPPTTMMLIQISEHYTHSHHQTVTW